jgi:hypothetical protein
MASRLISERHPGLIVLIRFWDLKVLSLSPDPLLVATVNAWWMPSPTTSNYEITSRSPRFLNSSFSLIRAIVQRRAGAWPQGLTLDFPSLLDDS